MTAVEIELQEPIRPVVVPDDPAMALEPARTIAEKTAPETQAHYSNVDRLKLAVAAGINLLVLSGVRVAPGVDDQVQDIITYGAPLVTMAYAWWQTERTKRAAIQSQADVQAEETREAVYSPAAAKALEQSEPVGET